MKPLRHATLKQRAIMQSFAKNQIGMLLVLALVAASTFSFGEEVEPNGRVLDQMEAIASNTFRPPVVTVSTNEWGKVVNECQLGARLEKAEFQVGEPIRVHAVLRTLSGREMQFRWRYGYNNDYTISVTRDKGTQVEPRPLPANTIPSGRGGSTWIQVSPTRRYRHIFNIGDYRYVLDEPGTYIITVTQRMKEVSVSPEMKATEVGNFLLVSNPVTLTIVTKDTPPSIPSTPERNK